MGWNGLEPSMQASPASQIIGLQAQAQSRGSRSALIWCDVYTGRGHQKIDFGLVVRGPGPTENPIGLLDIGCGSKNNRQAQMVL